MCKESLLGHVTQDSSSIFLFFFGFTVLLKLKEKKKPCVLLALQSPWRCCLVLMAESVRLSRCGSVIQSVSGASQHNGPCSRKKIWLTSEKKSL